MILALAILFGIFVAEQGQPIRCWDLSSFPPQSFFFVLPIILQCEAFYLIKSCQQKCVEATGWLFLLRNIAADNNVCSGFAEPARAGCEVAIVELNMG